MKFASTSVAALAAVAVLGAASFCLAQAPAAPTAAAAAATTADLKPGAYKADAGHTKITWSVSHGGFSTYEGQFADVQADLTIDADPAKSTLSVTIPLARMVSGSAGLDRHMATPDFFDVPNFANATFKSTSIAVTGANTGRVTGDLTIRNVTKPVTLNVIFRKGAPGRGGGHQLGFDATGTIKRSDFGMSYGLPNLGDDVNLRIGAEFRVQPPAAAPAQ